MNSFLSWFSELPAATQKPWLIMGKGPSFSKRVDYQLDDYNLLGLNHVIREQPVDVVHIIDLDVIESCGQLILNSKAVLVMPWHPHIANIPSARNLIDLIKDDVVLMQLESEGRLLFYNHSLAEEHHPDSAVISVKYFSAEAAFNLLVASGVQTIRTLGVDGGVAYSSDFNDLNDKTLLSNKRSSFDIQFKEFACTILRTGVDFAPLDLEFPINIFIATTDKESLAAKVLEYSIKKHASMSCEVTLLYDKDINIPGLTAEQEKLKVPRWLQYFQVPEACEYKGHAICLTSTMQVFKDIRLLWLQAFSDSDLISINNLPISSVQQFSIMLLNNAELTWAIKDSVDKQDAGKSCSENIIRKMQTVQKIRKIKKSIWHSPDKYIKNKTALLHYTDMAILPWTSTKNPLAYLWFRDLFEALDNGFISTGFIKAQIDAGWLRPSLWYQVVNRIDDPFLLAKNILKQDSSYNELYANKYSPHTSTWDNIGFKIKANMRHITDKPVFNRLFKKINKCISR